MFSTAGVEGGKEVLETWRVCVLCARVLSLLELVWSLLLPFNWVQHMVAKTAKDVGVTSVLLITRIEWAAVRDSQRRRESVPWENWSQQQQTPTRRGEDPDPSSPPIRSVHWPAAHSGSFHQSHHLAAPSRSVSERLDSALALCLLSHRSCDASHLSGLLDDRSSRLSVLQYGAQCLLTPL